jgi:RNA polymerase sigma factor (sigma-70 family)
MLLPGLVQRVWSDGLSPCSDRELLKRFADAGDEAAFATLLDRHGPMLLALCRRLLADAHLAEDVLQATFLVLARKAGSIRRRESLAGWLYAVARRLAHQARFTEVARRRRELRAAAGGETAAGDLCCDELLRALDEELQRLPERYRAPLLLCYLQGRTQDEAARHLGWSLSTLRRRLEGGRELLRARLTRRGATLGAVLTAGLLAPSAANAVLSAELRQAVLTAATAALTGAAVPASVLLLANGGMRMTTLAKVIFWSALAVMLGGSMAWALRQPGPARHADKPPASAAPVEPAGPRAEAPAAGRDLFNDPLPRGALARLGTVAFRHGEISWEGSLTFLPDGKHLVSTGGGWVRRWDLATGHAGVRLGDGWRNGMPGTTLATAGGKLARIARDVPAPTGGITWECTEYDLENSKQRTYHLEFPRHEVSQDPHGLPRFLSPDGRTYAELNDYGKLTLWDAAAGTVTHHLKPSGGLYTALAFPPGGKTVLVGDDSQTFRAFDLATGKEERSFGLLDGGAVAQMAISPNGKWLATIGGRGKRGPVRDFLPHDRFLRLWDVGEGKVVRTLDLPADPWVKALLFTPDSRTLLAGLTEGKGGRRESVRSWDVASGRPRRVWMDDAGVGTTLAVSPNGKILATMNESGVIRFWDRQTGQEQHPLDASPCTIDAVGFGPDAKIVLTAGADRAIRGWDARTGRPLGRPHVRLEKGTPLSFWSGPRPLLSCITWDENGASACQLYDPEIGKLLREQPGFRPVLSADGGRLATTTGDRRRIRIVDVKTGQVIQTLTPPEEKRQSRIRGIYPLGFTPDGRFLVVRGEEALSVWDVSSGERRSSWDLREKGVLSRDAERRPFSWERIQNDAVSPDGKTVVFSVLKDIRDRLGNGDWFGRVMLFETATGKLLHQVDIDDKESFRRLAFSPDSRRLAAAGRWTARVWDVATGKELRRFEGHRGEITSVAFSPDGRRLATASKDSTVLVWDVAGEK